MEKIAVEASLGSVREKLQQKGFEVVNLEVTQSSFVPGVCCCVISGQDKDVMGMADKTMDVPLVNARGMSDDEVLNQVQDKVKTFVTAQRL
jgi:hypothetical protein